MRCCGLLAPMLAFVLAPLLSPSVALKPVHVGTFDVGLEPGNISGEIFFIDSTQIYIRNFLFDVPTSRLGGDAAFLCGKVRTSTDHFTIPYINERSIRATHLQNKMNTTGLVIRYPTYIRTKVTELEWFGVCSEHTIEPDPTDPDYDYYYYYYNGYKTELEILAKVEILPSLVSQVPCEARLLGNLAGGSHGVSGRVYLLNRKTFAILGFSYNGGATDALFWVGAGNTPSVTGYPCTYESNSIPQLPAVDDQSLEVQITREAEGTAIDYFAVWSRTENVALGYVSLPSGLITTPPPPLAEGKVLLGRLTTYAHNVQGTLIALDNKTLLLENFYFDGNAPATRFLVVKGPSVSTISPANQHWYLEDETGSIDILRAYNDRSITLKLPHNVTVHDIDFFALWCVQFLQNFGDVQLPDTIILGGPVVIPTLPPVPVCAPIIPTAPMNCKQLSNDVTVSWIIDESSKAIRIKLCGCVPPDNYIAFGLSGSDSRAQMFGGDVTWTWLDNSGVHAGDLDLSAYSQCLITERNGVITRLGACPDAEQNVFDVNGYREGCTTCITYSRPLNSDDDTDKRYLLGEEQYVIWSVGPVGTINTAPLGRLTVPFKHYSRVSVSDMLKINFSRSPINECSLTCTDCAVELEPWPQPLLEHTTTISARIGHSGGERGYAGITGTAGWGISWYLNDLLIPNVTVIRGTTYTFVTEGGNDPANQARYHPFYITDSPSGGYLAKTEAAKQQETIFAGISGSTPLGVGRYCEYAPIDGRKAVEFASFDEFRTTLALQCVPGAPGRFTWTPDQNTPSTVYYQCATHQFLGWKINVVDGKQSTPDVINSTPPPEEVPLPLELHFVQDSPRVVGGTLEADFTLSRPADSVTCQLKNGVTSIQECSSGHVTFPRLTPGRHVLRVAAQNSKEDRVIVRRTINVPSEPNACSVYLVNDGVTVHTNGSARVEYAAIGQAVRGFKCTLDYTVLSIPWVHDSSQATVAGVWLTLLLAPWTLSQIFL